VLTLIATASAQQDRATNVGDVSDPAGVPLSGIGVKAANAATNDATNHVLTKQAHEVCERRDDVAAAAGLIEKPDGGIGTLNLVLVGDRAQ
jgi:hypothetical protein